ncbi:hypothetical protein [uncultured Amnibacterium sp.]|uniref:hypothetical protein n=1 Tax=uncultured Amnibacterium sp. TaxID=1631851 RepID=UPI0035CA7964
MPSIRFRLEKPTLNGLAARVAEQYGPDARILDTEESIVGGIAGIFGRRVIDVTVELPDRAAPDGAHEFSMRTRVGLAALLDDADAMDLGPAHALGDDPWAGPAPAAAAVSTQGGDFASVLDALRIDVEPAGEAGGGTPARPLRREPPATPTVFTAVPTSPRPFATLQPARPAPQPMRAVPRAAAVKALESAPRPAVAPRPSSAPPTPQGPLTPQEIAAAQQHVWATPEPRSRMGMTTPGAPPPRRDRPGDLLLLVGVGDDALRVAKALRHRMQKGYLCDGGALEGNTRRRVDDRRGAVAARAYGVRSDQPVIVAYGVGRGAVPDDELGGLFSIDSDQAWLVIDAERDPEETLEWTGRLRGHLQVDAVASLRAPRDGRPEAVEVIGLPEAWRELAG